MNEQARLVRVAIHGERDCEYGARGIPRRCTQPSFRVELELVATQEFVDRLMSYLEQEGIANPGRPRDPMLEAAQPRQLPSAGRVVNAEFEEDE